MRIFRRTLAAWIGLALAIGTVAAPASVFADAFSSWTPGPGAVLDNTYDGYIDQPTMNATVSTGGFTVSGWFVDKQAQGWAGADDVQIWQGTMDGGGKLLAKALFAQSRPDVAAVTGNPFWAASGFRGGVPSGSLAAGTQVISVYAHTPGKGWWFKQVQVTVSATAAVSTAPSGAAPAPVVSSGGAFPIVGIEKPKDGENVPTKSDYEIQGFALDKNASPSQGVAGSGIDRVDVYLGDRDAGAAFLGTADLGFSDPAAAAYGSQFASAGWRITFKPTKYKANSYNLTAYAHSVVTGKEDSASRYFVIKES
ncbi:MAG TPA: hypothetical protein VGQ62_18780 [Chloroflexota bacterium]|jgi:hypothetical protein|nr:hypothetical protein [Chloroflexota bacterium]